MKKLSIIPMFLAVMFAFTSCSKEEKNTGTDNPGGGTTEIEVPKANMSLVQKHTGSKCPPCGGWGWTANESIISTNHGNAAFVSAYSQNFVAQLFITQIATNFDAAWGINSWPTFTANGVPQLDRTSSGVNVNGEKAKVNAAVTAHKAATVVANTGFKTSFSGNTLTVDTRTKFFADANGDYSLAVYVTEDGVMGAQSGHPSAPNPVAHHNVLRGSATMEGKTAGTTWGEQIFTGAVTAGSAVNKKFTFDVTGMDQSKISVITTIWKKDGSKYVFVNANTNQK